MNPDAFTSDKTGRLVEISTRWGPDWAFIPDPIPVDWTLPNQYADLLGDAREQLGTLSGIGQTLPNPRLLLRPLQRREALTSSSLEGTHATPEELLKYELSPDAPTSKDDDRNRWREVHNYGRALEHGVARLDSLPLSNRLMREMHGILLDGVRGDDKRPGQFRDYQVHVGSDRRYVPPPAEHVDDCLADLEEFLHSKQKTNPIVRSCLVHYQFEAIHPFCDGNGRIGRVFMSLTTSQWLDHSWPWLYLSPFFEKHQDEYYSKLFRVSTHGKWGEWVAFCLRGVVAQCDDAIRRCKALRALRIALRDRVGNDSPRLLQIVDGLFDQPVMRVREVKQWCNVSAPTARSDIKKLEDAEIVRCIDIGKPKVYLASEIVQAAHGNLQAEDVKA